MSRLANEERGEVNLVTDDDKTYVLRLSNQAICETQARTGKTWGQLLVAMDNVDFVAYRDVLWVLLRAYHAKEFPNLVAVSTLIDDVGMARINVAVTRLFELNAAQNKAVTDAAAASANPMDAATSSTGEPRTSALGDSV